jgi:hypothetical protein
LNRPKTDRSVLPRERDDADGPLLPHHVDQPNRGARTLEVVFTAALVVGLLVLADLGEGLRQWRILLPPWSWDSRRT